MAKLIAAATLAVTLAGTTAAFAASPIPDDAIRDQVYKTEATAHLQKAPPGTPVYDKIYAGSDAYSVTYIVQPDGRLKFVDSQLLESQ
ncbi:hypothetical protein SAMN05880590_105165 [Rhizobium sp. RU35A]|uniref:PepSY domain-containing protein n=1 Tax=Rhizobium straminoryzae TaxID=1387186 RepID=A0A549ST21_9HYPH|nr:MULTISPECIES: hypothetical protein [Rhizobium]TRL32769.1 hypothetical protein FNA46_23350 [Rhizobium straminoryzae]SIQ56291.1 hypothetical protein SAMN05880590_105165 [Rhizobium sp. RU35A]